ncbi:MAG: hypothetical protein AAF810_25880 [Cyanobacteria bacterium P01_D01_bin.36]
MEFYLGAGLQQVFSLRFNHHSAFLTFRGVCLSKSEQAVLYTQLPVFLSISCDFTELKNRQEFFSRGVNATAAS